MKLLDRSNASQRRRIRTLALMPGLIMGVGLVNSTVTFSAVTLATVPGSDWPPSSAIWMVAGMPGRRVAARPGSGASTTESRSGLTAI